MRPAACLFLGAVLTLGLPPTEPARGDETHPTDATGAASLWTSDHPALVQARALVAQGAFARAEALLREQPHGQTDADRTARGDALETIRRVRRDFNQTEAQLVEALQKTIEDFSAEDLRRLTAAGEVTHRVIDGEVCYFRREPGVMLRFCDEVKERRAEWDRRRLERSGGAGAAQRPLDEDLSNATLNAHLADIARAGRAAHEAGEPAVVLPMRFRVRYTLTVKPADRQLDPALMRPGSRLRVWLPYPQEYRQQSEVALLSATIDGRDTPPHIAPPATDAHGPAPIGGSPQRTAYFETTVNDPTQPIVFEEVFEYTMAGHYPVLNADNVRELTEVERADFAHYLAERPPHLVFTDALRTLTDAIVGDQTHPYRKAKAIFDWWDANIRWQPELEYATIPSFAELCLGRRRGDCGVQAVTLIAMMRYAGIPARWQSGLTTTPGQENLHDWTEIYLAPHGWVVADPSYGYRQSDDADVRQFYFGHMDAYRLIVNLDYGRALDPPKPSLRSEPADFQRGEVEVDGTNLYFDDWSWDFAVESVTPVE